MAIKWTYKCKTSKYKNKEQYISSYNICEEFEDRNSTKIHSHNGSVINIKSFSLCPQQQEQITIT